MKTYKITAAHVLKSEPLYEKLELEIPQLQTVMDVYGRYCSQIDIAPDGTTIAVNIDDLRTLLKVAIDTLIEKKCADELNKRATAELAYKTPKSYRQLFYQ